MRLPFKQGDHNGMCGLYACYNAVHWLFPELKLGAEDGETDTARMLRRMLSEALPDFRSAWNDGTELQEMELMAEAARRFIGDGRLSYAVPFKTPAQPVTATEYWDRLGPMIEPAAACAVIGVDAPEPHWTVAIGVRDGRTPLFDSSGYEEIFTRTTVIGKESQGRWTLDPEAVIVFRREE